MSSPAPSPSAGSRGAWRGNRAAPPPRHDWQQPRSRAAGGSLGRYRTLWASIWFLLAVGLGCSLLWLLLYAPERTPVLTIAPTDFRQPLPPSFYVAEDQAALAELNRETLQLTDLSSHWRTATTGLEQLTARLSELGRIRSSRRPVVVYVNLYGAVDGKGRACLLTPAADPLESGTWLPISELLQTVEKSAVASRRRALVVLDCQKLRCDWNLGLLGNDFAERVRDEYDAAAYKQTVVLLAAGKGEQALPSPRQNGTLFGRSFCLGIAGAADRSDVGGNSDGCVSLRELHRYLTNHVAHFAAEKFAAPQQVQLLVHNGEEFDLAHSLRSATVSALLDRELRSEPVPANVSASDLQARWTSLANLRASRPWRFDPTGWRSLTRDVMRLEELSTAGKAYRDEARSLNTALQARLEEVTQRQQAAQAIGSLAAYESLLSGAPAATYGVSHSLPLIRLLGKTPQSQLTAALAELKRVEEAPSLANLDAALQALRQARLPGPTAEEALLFTWRRHHVPGVWPSASGLTPVWRAATGAAALAAPAPNDRLATVDAPGWNLAEERALPLVTLPARRVASLARNLQDVALLGPTAGDLAALAPDLDSELTPAQDLAADAAALYELRDRIWADLPYLAGWLTRPLDFADPRAAADDQVRRTLIPLLATAANLEQTLVADKGPPEESAWRGPATDLRRHWSDLHQLWTNHLLALETAPPTAATRREIDYVLAGPLLPPDARQRLRRKRDEIVARLGAGDLDQAEDEKKPAPAAAKQVAATTTAFERENLRERITAWGGHPLQFAFPFAAAKFPPASEKPAEFGQAVRESLRTIALADLTAADPQIPAERLRSAGLKQRAPAKDNELRRAEAMLRAAAGFWFPQPISDFVAQRRRRDIQQLLLHAAEQTLDDFFGPPAPASEPLFAIAVGDYLDTVEQLGDLDAAADQSLRQLRQLLAQRRTAALEALQVRAEDILLADQAAATSSRVLVEPKSNAALNGLPPGSFAFFLRDEQDRLGPPAQRIAQQIPAPGEPLLQSEVTLASSELVGRGPELSAVVTLRGVDFIAPVLLRAPGGARVAYVRPAPAPAQVAVLGVDSQRASILFVLDCSHSMGRALETESPDISPDAVGNRLTVAKRALSSMLDELSRQESARAGVVLFGHRVGWSTKEDNKLLRSEWKEEIPSTLRPSGDVQTILKLGRFDAPAAALVQAKLASAQPWGESPLYYALTQAIREFGPDDAQERMVVVITDGRNQQYNPPPEVARTRSDVAAAARQAGARVFVVGFSLSDEETQATGGEFEALARETRGQFYSAQGAGELLQTLGGLFRSGEYSVSPRAGGGSELRTPVGEATTLPLVAGDRDYLVALDGVQETVRVQGGERIELLASRGQRRLRIPAYRSPQAVGLLNPAGQKTSLYAGLHRPLLRQGAVLVPLSIQDREERFTARPAEFWVEVTPRSDDPDDALDTYYFFDQPFAPGTPVPYVELAAQDWPAAVGRATVRLFAAQAPIPPVLELPLSRLANRLPPSGAGFPLEGVPGASCQVRTLVGEKGELVVGVVERHAPASAGVGSLKLSLDPPADSADRRFDAKNRVVLHTFRYARPDPALQESIRLQIRRREDIVQGGLRLERELDINLSAPQDLIELR